MSEYFDYLYQDLESVEQEATSEFRTKMTSIVSSGVIAGLMTYLMRGNEPFYQVGVMGTSQFVGESLNQVLWKKGYETNDPKMNSVITALLSTGLYSIINRQSRLNEDMMANVKTGLVASVGGEALQYSKERYVKKSMNDDNDDCNCDTKNSCDDKDTQATLEMMES